MQEICRPVERIDVPSVTFVCAADCPTFLQHKAIAGPGFAQSVNEDRLGLVIRGRDEISGPLHRNLKVFQFSEIALQTAPGLESCSNHHIHQRGCDHDRARIESRYRCGSPIESSRSASAYRTSRS